MKKIMMMAIVMLVMVSYVGAYEIKNNPDRKISFGFNFDRYTMGGNYEYKSLKIDDAGTFNQNHFKIDINIPVLSFLSLNIGGGYSTISMGLALINKDERWNMKGYNLNAGFRIFIS